MSCLQQAVEICVLGFGSRLPEHLVFAWRQHTDSEPLQIRDLQGHLDTCQEEGRCPRAWVDCTCKFHTTVFSANDNGGGLC